MDNVASVSLGDGSSAAIKADGSLWTWGFNSYGQLGDGSTAHHSVPQKVMNNVTSVNLGETHSATIKKDGSLWTWGNNEDGRLGEGSTTNHLLPIEIVIGSNGDSNPDQNPGFVHDSNPIQYQLTLQDALTRTGLSNVTATYDGQTFTSDGSGQLSLKAGDILYAPITFSGPGYQNKTITVNDLDKYSNNIITLDPEGPSQIPFSLDLGSTTVDGPEVKIGPWTVPLFKMEAGINLGDFAIKQKIDPTQKTIYQSIGVEESVVDTEGDAYWKGTYKNLKDLTNGFGGKTDRQFYNDFRAMRKKLKQKNIKLGISCEGSACGFIEYSYASGKPQFKEGGLIFLVEPSVEIKHRFPETGGICYIRFKLTGSLSGKFVLTVVDTNITDPKLLAEITASVKAQLGIGADVLIANVEGGLEGEVGTTISIKEEIASLDSSLKMYLKGRAYIMASVFGFESDPLEYQFEKWQIYPRVESASMMTMALDNYEDYHLPSRDYLDTISTMALDDTNIAFSQNSVYPYGSPKIVTLANGRMMALWIGDNGTKATGNHTTLMYTLRDVIGTWSPAQAVYESGRTDLTPVVAVDGDQVYVLWQNGRKVFEDTITMPEMLQQLDLVCSVFDGNTFSEPVVVSNPETQKAQNLPSIDANNGKAVVSWVENNANDPYMATGTNTLFSRTLTGGSWSEISTLSTDIGYLNSIENNSTTDTIYMSKDGDGSPATTGDGEILALTKDGTQTSIGTGTSLKSIDGDYYWMDNDSSLWIMDAQGQASSMGLIVSNGYDVISKNGVPTVLYTIKDGFKNEIYTTTKNADGTWTTAVPLTSYNSFLRYFDAAADGQGNIIVAMDRVAVDENYDGTAGTSPYGSTDFIITSAEDRYDLAVNETLYYDTAALAAGGTIEVTAEVENTSTQTVDKLTLTWLDAADTVINSQEIAQSIGVGETAEVKTTYTLPNPLSHQTVKLKIEAAKVTEDNVNNNTATMEYGFSDVALESGELKKNADGTGTITVTVKNTGVDTAEGITVDLYKNGIEGENLGRQSVGSITSGQSKTLTYALTKEQMTCADEYDGKLFYLDAKSTSVESDYANNTNELLLDPVAAVGIALDQEAVTLTAGDTAQLKATLSPAEAVSKTHWISDDITVVTVDDTGKITAVAAGTAKVTAIAGEVTKQCTVTVTPISVARLYARTLTLEGNIGINFYMDLNSTLDPSTIYLKVWKDGKEGQATLLPYNADFFKENNGKKYYGFTYPVVAKEMADNINAKPVVMVDGKETQSGEPFNYSVQTYAKNMLASSATTDGLKALLVPMLNYGASAQNYFSYNKEALANADLSSEQKTIPKATLGEEYAASMSQGTIATPTAKIYGNSLILESATAVRYYIDLEEGVDAANTKLMYRRAKTQDAYTEVPLTLYKNNRYYAEIENIPAKKLGDMIEAHVEENGVQISETKTYGPMAYAKNKITQNTKETLVTLMNAMVDYREKAKAYFNYN